MELAHTKPKSGCRSCCDACNRYAIILRGETVAELVPAEENRQLAAVAAVAEMHAFTGAAVPVDELELKALMAEGRA